MCLSISSNKHCFVNDYPSHSCTIMRITPWHTLLCLFIINPSMRSQHKTAISKKSSTPLFSFLFHFLLLYITLCCHILSISISSIRALQNLQHRPQQAYHTILKKYTISKPHMILYSHKDTLKTAHTYLPWCVTADLHTSHKILYIHSKTGDIKKSLYGLHRWWRSLDSNYWFNLHELRQ